jgi:DNA polymerase-3 subunit alpha
VDLPEWPEHDMLAKEKELLGFYVTGHPLTPYAQILSRYCLPQPGAWRNCRAARSPGWGA